MADTRLDIENQITSVEQELSYYYGKDDLAQDEENVRTVLESSLKTLQATLTLLN